jgi:hypothetical protein
LINAWNLLGTLPTAEVGKTGTGTSAPGVLALSLSNC